MYNTWYDLEKYALNNVELLFITKLGTESKFPIIVNSIQI